MENFIYEHWLVVDNHEIGKLKYSEVKKESDILKLNGVSYQITKVLPRVFVGDKTFVIQCLVNKADLVLSNEDQHYWYNKGAMQTEMDRLTEKFVPFTGRSNNLNGEVIRSVNRLYYEYCNNGNGNAFEYEQHSEWVDCPHCNGNGYLTYIDIDGNECQENCDYCDGYGGYDDDVTHGYAIKHFYNNFIKLIRYYFELHKCKEGINTINEIEKIILSDDNCFDDDICVYDRLCDYAIWAVRQNENDNTPIPAWYDNE